VAIEESHAERIFEISNDFRHGGLRYAELLRRLGHAPPLNCYEEHMQVAQLEAAADLAFPVDPSGHGNSL
jgi:hypothetical protein